MITVAIDTETKLIRPGLLAPPLVCVSMALEDDVGLWHHTEAHDVVEFALDNVVVGHTIAFDLAVLGERYHDLVPKIFKAYEDGRVHDIATREKLYDIAHGRFRAWGNHSYQLAMISKRRIGEEIAKEGTWRLRYGELIDTPIEAWPEAAKVYAEGDAAATMLIYMEQEKKRAEFYAVQKHDYLGSESLHVRAAWALHLSSCWGIMPDVEAAKRLDALIRQAWEDAAERLRALGLVRTDGSRDTKAAKRRIIAAFTDKPEVREAVIEFLQESKMGPVPAEMKLTKKKDISLDEEACLLSGDSVMLDYARFGSLLKLRSTYIAPLKQTEGSGAHTGRAVVPIQPRYDEIVKTTRTSSFAINIQNIPDTQRNPLLPRLCVGCKRLVVADTRMKKSDCCDAALISAGVRECFVPRPGHVFVAADWDRAELVSLAQVCVEKLGYSRLADALREGFDPHTDLGARMAHCSYAELAALIEAGDSRAKNFRNTAKPCNFGFPGGLGAARFVVYAKTGYNVDVSYDEARELKKVWLESWPEMVAYFKWCDGMVGRDGYGHIIHPRSGLCRGRVSYTEMCNGFFQERIACVAKAALWEICRRQFTVSNSALYGSHEVAFIHDENILEVRVERAHEAAEELAEVMVKEAEPWVPDVPITASAVIMNYWSKDAKAMRDDEGRLIPWGEKRAA